MLGVFLYTQSPLTWYNGITMKILAIETSCDETAISIIETNEEHSTPRFRVLANMVLSQASLHAEYGGVFPNLAKREHAKALTPLLVEALKEAKLFEEASSKKEYGEDARTYLEKTLEREPELFSMLWKQIAVMEIPKIDAIAVTYGPGLEPALWVGINFAQALGRLWNIPVTPVNHMEGHILSAFINGDTFSIKEVELPLLALLISGGHTELVLMNNWMQYTVIGATRDDAVGEAFDKVARMLGLAYPGGPEISKLAEQGDLDDAYKLPRPMMNTDNFDFSFSGLKTAVRVLVEKVPEMTTKIKASIAKEFQQATTDVLVKKTLAAAEKHNIKTLVLGGGVSANKQIRESFTDTTKNIEDMTLIIPDAKNSTDNAVMIAVAGYYRAKQLQPKNQSPITAEGNAELG